MNINNIKNFIVKNRIIIIFLLIIAILIFMMYRKEYMESSSIPIKVEYMDIKNISIDPYDPFYVDNDRIYYINNGTTMTWRPLDTNGTPIDSWKTCRSGGMFSVKSDGNTMYGIGRNRALYSIGIKNINEICDQWGGFGSDKIKNITVNETIKKITPVNGAIWIEKDDGKQYVFTWDRMVSGTKKSLWQPTEKTTYTNMKYDKATSKIWYENNNIINFSTMGDIDLNPSITLSDISRKTETFTPSYDVYNDNLYVINKNSIVDIFQNKKYNIYKYIKETDTNYGFEKHILVRYGYIEEPLVDLCVTKNYVFILSKIPDPSDNKLFIYNIYISLSNQNAEDTLELNLKQAEFRKIITGLKNVDKLYSHPSCLYILSRVIGKDSRNNNILASSYIAYVKLEHNKDSKISSLETKKIQLETKIKDLETEIMKLDTEIKTLNNSMQTKINDGVVAGIASEKNKIISEKDKVISEKEAIITKLNDEISKLKIDLEKIKKDYETDIASSKGQNFTLEKKIVELEKQIIELKNTIDTLNKKVCPVLPLLECKCESKECPSCKECPTCENKECPKCENNNCPSCPACKECVTQNCDSIKNEYVALLSTANATIKDLEKNLDETRNSKECPSCPVYPECKACINDCSVIENKYNTLVTETNKKIKELEDKIKTDGSGNIENIKELEDIKEKYNTSQDDLDKKIKELEDIREKYNTSKTKISNLEKDIKDKKNCPPVEESQCTIL